MNSNSSNTSAETAETLQTLKSLLVDRVSTARRRLDSLDSIDANHGFVAVSSLWNGRGAFPHQFGRVAVGPWPQREPYALPMKNASELAQSAEREGLLQVGETLALITLGEWWSRELASAELLLRELLFSLGEVQQ